ncbi:MAG: 3-phosphoshikimate 1-carboxyvinyltransferase [Chlorobi bacterium]|nr:3-phosphoshikimate 1-carboxyvinyltransferase [Chlorobiota bacterium]
MSYIKLTAISKHISETIVLPASKSISNRVLIIRALNYGWFKIINLSESEDTKVLDEILQSNDSEFNVGDAGTAMRFLTAFLSKIVGKWILTGSARMQERPIAPLVDALKSIGADIKYLNKKGFPPLKITGMNLNKAEVAVDGGVSSQYITALLLIAPTLLNGLKINIKGELISQPYVDMTLRLMSYFGIHSIVKNNSIYVEHQNYEPKNIKIEPDWSAASYWYEIAALAENANIKLPGLIKNSLQGDAVLSEIYKALGVKTSFSQKGIRLIKTGFDNAKINYNLEKYPDISLALVVTAAIKQIPFKFTGLKNLKIKECNRIEALQNELQKFGIAVNEIENGTLECNHYPEKINKHRIIIETYNDHRIAMAFAPVSLIHNNVIIKNPEVVKKSYPKFWDDLEKVGIGRKKVNI